MLSVPFYLSFVSMLFPSNKDSQNIPSNISKCEPGVSTPLGLPLPTVRDPWHNAENAPGIFFSAKLCILFFSLTMLSVRVLAGNSTHLDGSNGGPFSEG